MKTTKGPILIVDLSCSEESEAVFVFALEDVFRLEGRGTVAVGIVQSGRVRVGDPLLLSDGAGFVCAGIELVQKRPKVEGFLALRLVDVDGKPADPERLPKGGVLTGTSAPRQSRDG
jgi:GTPase